MRLEVGTSKLGKFIKRFNSKLLHHWINFGNQNIRLSPRGCSPNISVQYHESARDRSLFIQLIQSKCLLLQPNLTQLQPNSGWCNVVFRVPRFNLGTLKISVFLCVCVSFLMVFQQAVTHRICACEAYASPVFYKPVQYFASLLANGTKKLISMGSQPNLKFNFNWVKIQSKFNFNWGKAKSKI